MAVHSLFSVYDIMHEIKDSKQAIVRIGYDGRVHKTYRGPMKERRFDNEVAVLEYLEAQGCPFVPRVLSKDREHLYLVTSNCGNVVDSISSEKMAHLFGELEAYGVRHEDAFMRNVTYSPHLGRFCLIDFEFATILDSGEGLTLKDLEAYNEAKKHEQS